MKSVLQVAIRNQRTCAKRTKKQANKWRVAGPSTRNKSENWAFSWLKVKLIFLYRHNSIVLDSKSEYCLRFARFHFASSNWFQQQTFGCDRLVQLIKWSSFPAEKKEFSNADESRVTVFPGRDQLNPDKTTFPLSLSLSRARGRADIHARIDKCWIKSLQRDRLNVECYVVSTILVPTALFHYGTFVGSDVKL